MHCVTFHSIPFHSIPFHYIPFYSIPFTLRCVIAQVLFDLAELDGARAHLDAAAGADAAPAPLGERDLRVWRAKLARAVAAAAKRDRKRFAHAFGALAPPPAAAAAVSSAVALSADAAGADGGDPAAAGGGPAEKAEPLLYQSEIDERLAQVRPWEHDAAFRAQVARGERAPHAPRGGGGGGGGGGGDDDAPIRIDDLQVGRGVVCFVAMFATDDRSFVSFPSRPAALPTHTAVHTSAIRRRRQQRRPAVARPRRRR